MNYPRAIVYEQAEDPNLWRMFGGELAPVTLHEALLQAALRRLHAAVEAADLRPAVAQAVAELDAEHRKLTEYNSCVICWPSKPGWPCVARQVADDLRVALGEGDSDAEEQRVLIEALDDYIELCRDQAEDYRFQERPDEAAERDTTADVALSLRERFSGD